MKAKTLFILLAVELAAIIALLLLTNISPANFSSLLAFPFEQIGAGLRSLSLSGRLGNGLALAIWGGISMLPIFGALRHKGEADRRSENAALYLLSGIVFFVLCGMANPAMFGMVFPVENEMGTEIIKSLLGGTFWSVLAYWLVLRLLRLFREGHKEKLLLYMRSMLYALCAVFTGAIAINCAGSFISLADSIQKPLDGFVYALSFFVSALPYAMDIAVTLSALKLLEQVLAEKGEIEQEANRLSRLCCTALGLTSLATVAFNIIQLALVGQLSNVSISVNIPVLSLAFVLAVLLLTRLIVENRRLRDDNQLFI